MGSQRVGHDLATKPPFRPPPYITDSIFSVIIRKSTGHLRGFGGCCPNCPSSSYSRPCIVGFGQFKLCHSTCCEVTPSFPTEIDSVQFSSVQSLSRVRLFATPWIAACQASLSYHQLPEFTQTRPSNQWCHPAISFSATPFSSCLQSVSASGSFPMSQFLHIRWPKYWSSSFSISPSNEHSGLISLRIDWFDLLAIQGTLKSLLQHHSLKASVLRRSAFFMVQLSHSYMTTGKTTALTIQTFVRRVMSLIFNTLSLS